MQSDGTAEYSLAYIWDHNKFRNVSGQLAFLDYLTPYLAPGVRILDVGCGLGTLSIALAQKDPDCEVYAIDISEEQIEIAKAQAQERGVGNVRFSVADVLDIPFEDGYFDIVHGNDVLAWIPDTAAALAQIKRVLKTGGSVAFREMIMEGSFGYPLGSLGRRGWDVFVDLMEAEDAHPQMGMRLKHHLHEAGFADIRMTASFETYATPEEIEILYGIATNWFMSLSVTESAKMYGAATDEIFEEIGKAAEAFLQHPGAFAGIAFGQALAISPE